MQVDIAEEAASSGGVLIRMRSSIVEAKKGALFSGGGDFNYFEHVFKERTRQINQGTFY